VVDLYTEFLVGVINASAAVILTFVIFKIPVKGNDKQIAIIGLALGATNFYLKFMIHLNVAQIVQIIVFLLLITVIRRYPILYSAAVSVIGSIAYSIIDGVVTFSLIKMNLTSMNDLVNNNMDYITIHIIVTVFYLAVAYILTKYKIGFSFVVIRFSGKYSLSSATFVWAAVLVLAVFILQVSSQNFVFLSVNSYMLIFAILVLFMSIIYAYFQNKKALKDRYGEK
jgi:hypothetical protein